LETFRTASGAGGGADVRDRRTVIAARRLSFSVNFGTRFGSGPQNMVVKKSTKSNMARFSYQWKENNAALAIMERSER
jgi:hypothetical protein